MSSGPIFSQPTVSQGYYLNLGYTDAVLGLKTVGASYCKGKTGEECRRFLKHLEAAGVYPLSPFKAEHSMVASRGTSQDRRLATSHHFPGLLLGPLLLFTIANCNNDRDIITDGLPVFEDASTPNNDRLDGDVRPGDSGAQRTDTKIPENVDSGHRAVDQGGVCLDSAQSSGDEGQLPPDFGPADAGAQSIDDGGVCLDGSQPGSDLEPADSGDTGADHVSDSSPVLPDLNPLGADVCDAGNVANPIDEAIQILLGENPPGEKLDAIELLMEFIRLVETSPQDKTRILEAFIRALGDNDASVREQIARVLWTLGNSHELNNISVWLTPEMMQPLINASSDDSRFTRDITRTIIRKLFGANPPPALVTQFVDSIIQLLGHEGASIRENAIWILWDVAKTNINLVEKRKIFTNLIGMLDDNGISDIGEPVTASASSALCDLERSFALRGILLDLTEEIIPPIVSALSNNNGNMRDAAGIAIQHLNLENAPPEQLAQLIDAIINLLHNTELLPSTRQNAARVLGSLVGRNILLEEKSKIMIALVLTLDDENSDVRQTVAGTLNNYRALDISLELDEDVINSLINALRIPDGFANSFIRDVPIAMLPKFSDSELFGELISQASTALIDNLLAVDLNPWNVRGRGILNNSNAERIISFINSDIPEEFKFLIIELFINLLSNANAMWEHKCVAVEALMLLAQMETLPEEDAAGIENALSNILSPFLTGAINNGLTEYNRAILGESVSIANSPFSEQLKTQMMDILIGAINNTHPQWYGWRHYRVFLAFEGLASSSLPPDQKERMIDPLIWALNYDGPRDWVDAQAVKDQAENALTALLESDISDERKQVIRDELARHQQPQ